MKNKILILLLILAPSIINAQVGLNCVFQIVGTDYDCRIDTAFVPDNEQIVITFGGQHQTAMTNAQVSRIIFTTSLIPFIIPSIFTTFVNLREYHYTNSQFETRVQANAFSNAPNVQEITISSTGGLSLAPTGFTGAISLQRLNLQTNNITSLPNTLLNGLTNLTSIDFSNNGITVINDNFLRTNTFLTSINLNNNNIRRLPNTLLMTNNLLAAFHAQTNNIYQIGRAFLDHVSTLTTLSLAGNECVNLNFGNIGGVGGPTKEQIITALQVCFNNYVGGAELREYNMHLRGRITFFDEYGNLVGRL